MQESNPGSPRWEARTLYQRSGDINLVNVLRVLRKENLEIFLATSRIVFKYS